MLARVSPRENVVLLLGPTYAGKTSFIVTSCCFLTHAERRLRKRFFVEGNLPGAYGITDPSDACTKTILRATVIFDEVKIRGSRGTMRLISVSGNPPESGVIREDIEDVISGFRDANIRFVFFFDLTYDIEKHITLFQQLFLPMINRALGKETVRNSLLYNKFFAIYNKGDEILRREGKDALENRMNEYEATFLALLVNTYGFSEDDVISNCNSYVTFCDVRSDTAKMRDIWGMLKNSIRAFIEMCRYAFGQDEYVALCDLVDEWIKSRIVHQNELTLFQRPRVFH